MGIFWCDIKYVEVDVIWLLKVTTHLDKLEKIQSKSNGRSQENIHEFLTLENGSREI